MQANNLFHYKEMTVVLDGWNAEYYSGPERVIAMHEETLEALLSRDPDRIRMAMADHLNDAETIAPDLDRRLIKPRRQSRPTPGNARQVHSL